jgi:ubiquinone/menaquinone biosynthesis C-methylase UbiE
VRRPEFIARQSGNPRGFVGGILARIMAFETADQNRRALDALAVSDGDDVLELGYGHGRTLEAIARLTPSGRIAGVDVSEDMRDMASRRCAGLARTVDLFAGDTRRLPFEDASFSRALAVHLLYFWEEPDEHLTEIYRVLRRGGRLVLAFRDKADPASADFPEPPYRFYSRDEVVGLLGAAGFSVIETVDPNLSCTIVRAIR